MPCTWLLIVSLYLLGEKTDFRCSRYVRAGQFRFRVESKVAVREAVIDSDWMDDSTTPPTETTVMTQDITSVDPENRGSPNPVYARLTKSSSEMTSILTIKVVKPNKAEKEMGNDWRVLPIRKKVPSALWGQCEFQPILRKQALLTRRTSRQRQSGPHATGRKWEQLHRHHPQQR